MRALFIDSWGWIVLADLKDPAHPAVSALYRREREAGSLILTTDYVMSEIITFLFAKAPLAVASKYLKALMDSVDQRHIQMERAGPDRFEKAWKMRLKYGDHPRVSFTDFTSFVIMKELGIERVLTNDRHFEQVNLGFEKLPREDT